MTEILRSNELQSPNKNESKIVNFTNIENKVNEIERLIWNEKDWKEFYVNKMNKILSTQIPWVKLNIIDGKIKLVSNIWKEDLDKIMEILEQNKNKINNKNIDINKTTSSQILSEHQKQISMWNVNFLKDLLLTKDDENNYKVDFKDNIEAELHIWLADILPSNVRKVRIQWNFEWEEYDLTWTRIWDKWWFYSENHDYLPIYQWFKITIIEEWDEEKLNNSKNKLNKQIEEFKNTQFYRLSKSNFDEITLDKLVKSSLEYWINPTNLIGLYKLKNTFINNFWQVNSWVENEDAQISLTCKRIQQSISEYQKVWWNNPIINNDQLNPEFIIFMKNIHPIWLKWDISEILKTITNKDYSANEINLLRWKVTEQITKINNIYTNNWENQDVETVYGEVLIWYEWLYNPREINSEPFERSPSWCTLCAKTARLNLLKFWWKCRRWDAISLVNDNEYHWWNTYNRLQALNLLEQNYNDKWYYHVSIAKNDGKHWNNNPRNWHSFVVFKWNDWETYVMDPYYFGWSTKPHKLLQHPLAYNDKYSNSKWAIMTS